MPTKFSLSVYVPVKNGAATIGETLASLIRQSHKEFDLVVMDNGSTDGTDAVVAGFSDPRLRFVRGEPVSHKDNFERCLRMARGDCVVLAHADDVYEESFLEAALQWFVANPEGGAVFSGAAIIDGSGRRIGIKLMPLRYQAPEARRGLHSFHDVFRDILRHHNFLVTPSAMIRRQAHEETIGSWDFDRFRSSVDLWVWLSLARRYGIGVLPEPLMRYRRHPAQDTATVNRSRTDRADFFRVVDFFAEEPDVKEKLRPVDRENRSLLEFVDLCIRAVNLLALDRPSQAIALLPWATIARCAPLVLRRVGEADQRRYIKWLLLAVALRALAKGPGRNVMRRLSLRLSG